MKRRYRLTPEARLDLLSIWEYVASDDPEVAERLTGRMERAFSLLAEFPNKGHRRSDVHTTEPVLFWPVGNYMIVYRPKPSPVLIVRIIHGARDLDALL